MKVTLFMATTPNGIIARENYEEDFLSEENWSTFLKLMTKIKCLIWGRTTYEKVIGWGGKYVKDLEKFIIIIVSSSNQLNFGSSAHVANSPSDALNKAKALGFGKVLLSGGGKINSSFLKEELVDEIILNIEPVILGKGISLFAEGDYECKLELVSSKKIKDKIIQIYYKVLR